MFLNIESPSQCYIAVQMAFVKLIEDDGLNAGECRIVDQLAEQNAFRFKLDAGRAARHILESDLIADLMPDLDAQFLRHT